MVVWPQEAIKRGIVATIAAITIWRWLSEDAIRPWIFPRAPPVRAEGRPDP